MPVFQYKCGDCAAIFDYLISGKFKIDLDCMACGSTQIARAESTSFYPNKNFCPHDKVLDKEVLKVKLSGILKDTTQRCGGCGTDGAPGKCPSGGGGGGCGSGGGCGGGCGCKKSSPVEASPKLSLDIYAKGAF